MQPVASIEYECLKRIYKKGKYKKKKKFIKMIEFYLKKCKLSNKILWFYLHMFVSQRMN